MAYADTLTPSVVDTCGGNIVTLTGAFDTQTAYVVVCIPSANPVQPQLSNASRFAPRAIVGRFGEDFPLCYSGVAGQGVYCYSTDGTSLQFAAPHNVPGPLRVTVYDQATGENFIAFGVDGLSALPPLLSSMTFTLRTTLPLAYATGPRNVASVPVPDSTAEVAI